MKQYVRSIDAVQVGPATSRATQAARSTLPNETVQRIQFVRERMRSTDAPIITASSRFRIASITTGIGGLDHTCLADITTSYTWGGRLADLPSGTSTDRHLIRFDQDGTTVSDEIFQPASDLVEGPELSTSKSHRPSESSLIDASGFTTLSQPFPSVASMRSYAMNWTSSANANAMNPDYPIYDNNCANFVSQILHAGGWEYKGGVNPYDTLNWTPNLTGPAGASRTWSSSQYQIAFVSNDGNQYGYLDNIWNAGTGDLLYADWYPNDTADGTVDHVMFVAFGGEREYGPGFEPIICQKSPNRGGIPLSQSIANAESQGKHDYVWYGKTLTG